jgi:hypothetical protein
MSFAPLLYDYAGMKLLTRHGLINILRMWFISLLFKSLHLSNAIIGPDVKVFKGGMGAWAVRGMYFHA